MRGRSSASGINEPSASSLQRLKSRLGDQNLPTQVKELWEKTCPQSLYSPYQAWLRSLVGWVSDSETQRNAYWCWVSLPQPNLRLKI